MKTARNSQTERPLKTLERYFSKAGLASRTDARSWIGGGRVRVNGKVVRNPDHWVDLERDRVTLDGKPLRSAAKTYILLYKPKGYITTHRDPEGRPTVYDLIGDAGTWLSPVGRLDLDTSGLLILTNDTEFAERVTNPDHKVSKTYQIKTATILNDDDIERLCAGVALSDGMTRPAEVRRLREGAKRSYLEMTITEGRNRQVRRMIEAVNSKVQKLVRTAIGPVRIGDLRIGGWRRLTSEEVAAVLGEEPRRTGPTSSSNLNTSAGRRLAPPPSRAPRNPAARKSGSGTRGNRPAVHNVPRGS
ncbi:MAG TPA: pseudouridine synthase [Bryobacteraceae bacterium]|nr:pseudouridine synthase [Bryobacteraceae bacterium]